MVGMVHNLVDEHFDRLSLVGFSWCGDVKDLPVIAAIRQTTIGAFFGLWAKCNTIYQGNAISLEQANLLPARAEFKTCMQRPFVSFTISPNQQVALWADGGRSRIIIRNPPSPGKKHVICQIQPAYINGIITVIVNFNPIVIIALRVPDEVVILSHKLVDN
ncbi:hypothetical protein ES707_22909 [subsurface metagenome]